MTSTEVRQYFKERGWNWTFPHQPVKPDTHFKYGASHLLIPKITVHRS